MKDEILKLEKKLNEAKLQEDRNRWEKHLEDSSVYLKSLINKTFVRYYQNGKFVIFKVVGIEEKYYVDCNGFNGSWHPSRWFELVIEQAIHCSVRDSFGRYFRPEVKYQDFKFNRVTGRQKNKIETSKLNFVDYKDEKYTYIDSEVREFGKLSYDEKIPDFDRDLSDFKMFLKEVPEQMWLDAKKIADDNLMKTYEFWNKYETIVQSL